jgi:hypothetical protein
LFDLRQERTTKAAPPNTNSEGEHSCKSTLTLYFCSLTNLLFYVDAAFLPQHLELDERFQTKKIYCRGFFLSVQGNGSRDEYFFEGLYNLVVCREGFIFLPCNN